MWLLPFLILFLIPQSAFAQTPAPNTLSVSPSFIKIDLQQDEAQATLTYTNNSQNTVELEFSASDFTNLEDGYKLSFLEPKNVKNYQYRLSSWIDFEQKNLVLAPHSTGQITVFINKDKLTPGGHYTAILAHLTNHTNSETIGVQGMLSSLLFVRTATGKELEEGKVTKLEAIRDLIDFPQTFLLRFQNTGTTDLTPYGLITITDNLGRVVAKGILNENSLITLPESIRRFDIPVKKQTSLLLPGTYTAKFEGHFGKNNHQIQTSLQFFSQGSLPLIPLGIILILLLIILKVKKRSKQ